MCNRVLFSLLLGFLIQAPLFAAPAPNNAMAGVAAFNRAYADATRHMHTTASMALWEEDGTSLLPSMQPMHGKPVIEAFVRGVVARMPNAHMQHFDMQCHDIRVSGDWASEWCDEHQVVTFPGRPAFDGRGKMLLVLHHDADGNWRLQTEMWNQGAAPAARASG